MINVNSIRPVGGTSLRARCEVRPVAHAFRTGKSLAVAGGAGQQDNERLLKETVSERKAAPSPSGGWRQNGRKCKRGKQGDLSGITRRSWPEGPKNRSTGVRASLVAKKRVTSVEPRDAGRWKDEEQNNGGPTDASARKGYAAAGDPPSTIDWAGTARLAGILMRAKSGRHLAETPLTGKLDAGNPPVQFGGRGEVNPSSLPLSLAFYGRRVGRAAAVIGLLLALAGAGAGGHRADLQHRFPERRGDPRRQPERLGGHPHRGRRGCHLEPERDAQPERGLER